MIKDKVLKMYYETAYIKRYIKNTKYKTKNNETRNRTIETISIKGLKKSSKFKDNDPIIIINENDFKEMENELKQLREQNQELINNVQTEPKPEQTNNIKLLELYEQINNTNELLFNASNNYNNVLDLIINELSKEYNNLILENNKANKKALELYLKELEKKNNELINNAIENINKQLTGINEEFNNIGFIGLYRKRKHFNINLDLEHLENINISGSGFGVNNLLLDPNFNNIDVGNIKEIAKKELNFNDFYVNFSKKNNLIDL